MSAFSEFSTVFKYFAIFKGPVPLSLSLHTRTNPSAPGFPAGPVARVRLAVQGTSVRFLVQEDPTCHGATRHCNEDPAQPLKIKK